MNVTISIQDCSLQELQVLFARLGTIEAPAAAPAAPAAAPLPEPEPAPEPEIIAPKPKPAAAGEESEGGFEYVDPRGKAVKVYHPSGASKVYNSLAEAAKGVGVSDSTVCKLIKSGKASRKGFRFEYYTGEAAGKRPSVSEAIKALKKLKAAEKPVVGYHKDGTIKYFHTAAEASRYCSCSVSFIDKNAGTGTVSGTGWRFEYDQEGTQRTRKGGAR